MSKEMPHQYEVLFKKAVADIEIARLAITAHAASIDDATIMFHLQQGAEKLLKTLLAFHEIHFEKVHDLLLLISSCEESHITLPEYTSRFAILNPFAVMGWYDIVDSCEVNLTEWIAILDEFKMYVQKCITSTNEETVV